MAEEHPALGKDSGRHARTVLSGLFQAFQVVAGVCNSPVWRRDFHPLFPDLSGGYLAVAFGDRTGAFFSSLKAFLSLVV